MNMANNKMEDQAHITHYDLNVPPHNKTHYAATIIFHPDFRYIGATFNLQQDGDALKISRDSMVFSNSNFPNGTSISDIYISCKPLTITPCNSHFDIHLHPESSPVYINGQIIYPDNVYTFDAEKKDLIIDFNRRVFVCIHKKDLPVNDARQLGMLGISDEIQAVRNSITRVADTDIPVLIRGESGTGKELVASALHQLSERSEEQFVAANVSAIPESLVTAELFGVQKGAFTGATSNKKGFFQQSNRGTLFLDEIGDASNDLQLALLRALECGEIRPVGANKNMEIDIRFIAATDACLEEKLLDNKFRTPLLQRLAGYEIWLPALRDRCVDIGILLAKFIDEHCKKLQCRELLNPGNTRFVTFWIHFFFHAIHFTWPGNIRQLRNVVQQVIVHNRGNAEPNIPEHIVRLFQQGGEERKCNEVLQTSTAKENPIKNTVVKRTKKSINTDLGPTAIERKPRNISDKELLKAFELNRYDLKNTAQTLGISRGAIYKLVESNPLFRKAGDLSIEEIERCFHTHLGDLEKMVGSLKVSKFALKRRLKEMQLV